MDSRHWGEDNAWVLFQGPIREVQVSIQTRGRGTGRLQAKKQDDSEGGWMTWNNWVLSGSDLIVMLRLEAWGEWRVDDAWWWTFRVRPPWTPDTLNKSFPWQQLRHTHLLSLKYDVHLFFPRLSLPSQKGEGKCNTDRACIYLVKKKKALNIDTSLFY